MDAIVRPETGKAYQLKDVRTVTYHDGQMVITFIDRGELKTTTFSPDSLMDGSVVIG